MHPHRTCSSCSWLSLTSDPWHTALPPDVLCIAISSLPQVLERRQGLNFRVNMKERGDTFGEVSLMYNVPRSATVAATRDSVVWVLEREQFR